MPAKDDSDKIVPLRKPEGRRISSTEAIWGKAVLSHGYAAIPSILIRAQKRLGINYLQMNIIVQLLDYWRDPANRPFPSRKDIADRIGVLPKTIQNNVRQLEKAGLVRREKRKTAAGDWNSNIYHLDGLVQRVQQLEPEFTEAREVRRKARRFVETPKGLRVPS